MRARPVKISCCRPQGLGRESVVEQLPDSHKVLGYVLHTVRKRRQRQLV